MDEPVKPTKIRTIQSARVMRGRVESSHLKQRFCMTCLAIAVLVVPGTSLAFQAHETRGTEAAGVQTFNAEFFAQYNSENAWDMVGHVPGFNADLGQDARGYAASAGNILVDSQRPASKEGIDNLLIRIPASQVERIELITGGAPGIDMQGRSQVVNVVRKVDQKGNLLAQYVVKLDPGHNHHWLMLDYSRKSNGKSIGVTAESYTWTNQDVFNMHRRSWTPDRARDSVPDETYLLQDHKGTGLRAKVEHSRPLVGGVLALRLFWDDTVGNQDVFFDGVTDSTDVWRRQVTDMEGGAQYTRPLTDALGLELNFIQRQNRVAFKDRYITPTGQTDFSSRMANGERIVTGRLTWTKSDSFSMQFGGENVFNTSKSQSQVIINNANPAPAPRHVDVEEQRNEYSVIANWKPIAQLSAEAGLRVETSKISVLQTNKSREFVYPKPSLQFVWSPSQNLKLTWRAEKSIGQLSFFSFADSVSYESQVINAGNPDLVPQKTFSNSLNADYSFWGAGIVSLNLKHEDYEDVLDRIAIVSPSGVFDAAGNIGDGTLDRASFGINLPMDKLLVRGGLFKAEYGINRTRVTDPITHQKRNISRVNPSDYSFSFSQSFPAKRFSYGLNAESSYTYEQFGATDYLKYDNGINATLWLQYTSLSKINYTLRYIHPTDWKNSYERKVWNGLRGGTLAREEITEGGGQPLIYLFIRKDF